MPFMPLNETPPHGPHEADFRRGYHHGAIAMVRALQAGYSAAELEAFVNAEVRAWREDHAVPAFPPEPSHENPI